MCRQAELATPLVCPRKWLEQGCKPQQERRSSSRMNVDRCAEGMRPSIGSRPDRKIIAFASALGGATCNVSRRRAGGFALKRKRIGGSPRCLQRHNGQDIRIRRKYPMTYVVPRLQESAPIHVPRRPQPKHQSSTRRAAAAEAGETGEVTPPPIDWLVPTVLALLVASLVFLLCAFNVVANDDEPARTSSYGVTTSGEVEPFTGQRRQELQPLASTTTTVRQAPDLVTSSDFEAGIAGLRKTMRDFSFLIMGSQASLSAMCALAFLVPLLRKRAKVPAPQRP
jgi:hypothetical protein